MLATSRAEGQPSRNEADTRAGSTDRRSAISKSATKEGTKRYAEKFRGRAAQGHFREMQRLALSSLGIGTYLGEPDEKTDEGYAGSRRGGGKRHQCNRRGDQLQISAERTKHRRGHPAACGERH